MANWLQRLRGKSEVLGAVAFNDIMSVLYTDKSAAIITDARTAVDKSVWILRAVSTVSTRIGSLPWKLYNGDKVVEGKSAVLTRPSPNQTGTEFVERIIAWELLQGTGGVYVETPTIKGLTVLDMDMLRMDHGNILYRELDINGQPTDRQLKKENIVLFPNFSISGQMGLSELRPILDTANMDEGAKSVWNNQMSSGGALAGLMTTDFKLTGPELMAAKKAWEEKYSGIQKAGGIGWLSAGYHFEKLGISAADLKLLEVSKVTREEIGAAFGVPGIYLNDTQSVDYSNAQTQERVLYTNVVKPKADRLADRITTFLLPLLPGLKGLTFKFDYTGIECLKGDALLQAQTDEIELRMGKITINEICKRDNVKEKKWGDTWWASPMLVPISDSEIAPPPEPIAPVIVAPVVPPEPAVASPQEPKGLKALHTPEARKLIAKAFISKLIPQEKKFAGATQKVFNKQAKVVTAWVESGAKGIMPAFGFLSKADDVNSSYIRIRVHKAEDFVEGSFFTSDVDETAGIYITLGDLIGEEMLTPIKTSTPLVTPQALIFEKAKGWTLDMARVWLDRHDYHDLGIIPAGGKAIGSKAVAVPRVRALLVDSDLVDNWHSLFVAFSMQSAEDVAARYSMQVPDGSAILKWIRAQESKHSKLVNDTTSDEISKILADARANGQSIPEMVKATKQYFDNVAYRAERVARTNVVACNNASAQDVYTENGVEGHEWLATADDRTRDAHAEADGQVRPIHEPFDVGGEQLMYPGDPAGSADNDINCRCTELPVLSLGG